MLNCNITYVPSVFLRQQCVIPCLYLQEQCVTCFSSVYRQSLLFAGFVSLDTDVPYI